MHKFLLAEARIFNR